MEFNLCDINTVKMLLAKYKFSFSKDLGQNFLIDDSVCPEMAHRLNADDKTGVLEIGPGIGVLTKELCETAGKVVAVELDKRLYPLLAETLGDYDNFELIEGDVMKLNLAEIISQKFADCDSVKVCANLPYYITSPIVMMLLESNLPIDEIEVMVQREAAQRLCAEIGTRDAGAVTVAVNYYGEAEILFDVGKESFMPSPKVDSAVIKITLRKQKKFDIDNEKAFFTMIKGAFSQRRKTLVNSLSSTAGISKDKITCALGELGISPTVRAEKMGMEDFVSLYGLLY